MPIFAAPNKGTTFFSDFGLYQQSPIENSGIQGLFKAFEWFSSTFQGRFNFQGLFKKALLIQVLLSLWTVINHIPFITLIIISQIWILHSHVVAPKIFLTMKFYNDIIGKWPFYGHFPIISL